MRISTSQLQQRALSSILEQQNRVSRTQLQLGSGKRILSPSDDPAGAARLLDLKQGIQINEQYQENINITRARLNIEESALTGVEDLLRRVKELTIQANNSTNGSEGRVNIGFEIQQRLNELIDLANTKDGNGEYIFSGFQGLTQAFSQDVNGNTVFNGDQGQRFLQVSSSRQVADRDSGSDVFMAVGDGNGTFSVNDNANNTGSGIIHTGAVTDASLYDGDTYSLIFGSQTTATTANVAAFAFNDVIGTNDNLTYTLQINGTTVYTVNEGGTPVSTLQGLADEINNDSGTTGVSAYISGGTIYLANTSPSVADIVVNESMSGNTATDNDSIVGYFGTTLTETTPSASTTFNSSGATHYVVIDSDNNVETAGAYQADSGISFNGITTSVKGTPDIGDRFTISPSGNRSIFSTIKEVVDALQPNYGPPGHANNTLNRMLQELDNAESNILTYRASIGARLNAIDDQENINEDFILNLNETLSSIEDLDYADAASRFESDLVALQAAQQSFVRIQGLSLFNFL